MLNGHKIIPSDQLKHLGFIWSIRKKKPPIATLEDVNLQERVNKFWAVIHTLIKGGVRFCHPTTIVDIFKTIAVPTLSYGLELCDLSKTQLDKLDKEGRKALKYMFNISKFSRNYINSMFSIDNISTTLIQNKLNFFSRLMGNSYARMLILRILQEQSYPSYIHQIVKLTDQLGIDFMSLMILRKSHKLVSCHEDIPPEKEHILGDCIQFWQDKDKRIQFKLILEGEHT